MIAEENWTQKQWRDLCHIWIGFQLVLNHHCILETEKQDILKMIGAQYIFVLCQNASDFSFAFSKYYLLTFLFVEVAFK